MSDDEVRDDEWEVPEGGPRTAALEGTDLSRKESHVSGRSDGGGFTRLGEGINLAPIIQMSRVRKVPPNEPRTRGQEVPFRHQLRQRLTLPMWDGYRFQPVFVDDRGSCSGQHVFFSGVWHRYQDKKGNLYALRCPFKLTRDEENRLVEDIPPGSWEEKTETMRQEKLRAEEQRKREEKAARRSNGWTPAFR